MSSISRALPLYAVVAALALSACTAVAERPVGTIEPYDSRSTRDRDDRHARDDRDRRVDRYEDRDDDRRRDRDDDRRDDRRYDDRRNGGQVEVRIGAYFGDRDRDAVYDYNRKQGKNGKGCPPGLAKKGNGCQPPGQAKKWRVGQPLPRDVAYAPLEADVRVRLRVPPRGYEYVRVAQDILMIAVGTAIVIDAIEDLQR